MKRKTPHPPSHRQRRCGVNRIWTAARRRPTGRTVKDIQTTKKRRVRKKRWCHPNLRTNRFEISDKSFCGLYNLPQIHAVYLIRFYQEALIDGVNRSGLNHVVLIYLINSNRMNRVVFFYAVYWVPFYRGNMTNASLRGLHGVMAPTRGTFPSLPRCRPPERAPNGSADGCRPPKSGTNSGLYAFRSLLLPP